jgi:Lon protease-like protein
VKLDSLAEKLTSDLQVNLVKLREETDRQLKALFSPLLNERLEAKAIEDFCNSLAAAVGKDVSRNLVVAAPPELQQKLAARLAMTNLQTSLVHAEGTEILASIEATEITTEIDKWKADLQRLLT